MPVVVGNEVFISETYGVGSSLLEVKPGEHKVIWSDDPRKREKAMKCHWNTPINVDGYLYGCSGRNEPDSNHGASNGKPGEIMWSEVINARTSWRYVDGYFVCLGEYGSLQLIRPNPKKLDVVAEVTLQQKEWGRYRCRNETEAAPKIPLLGGTNSFAWAAVCTGG